jgi:putative N6-adenine-specific DNA methylase
MQQEYPIMEKEEKNSPQEWVAKTVYGLEDILAGELKELGAGNIRVLNRAVGFKGDMDLMIRSNYCLRTALRILKPILSVHVSNENELYKAVRSIRWNEWLDKNGTLAVDSTVNSEIFSHSHYAAQKVKDAIVDQFRDLYGIRPSVRLENPDLQINIHISGRMLTISLDSSGDSLHKRGYRTGLGKAPLNEVLAAGLIMLSGWDAKSPLVDPMCGSGTLPIEAALIAQRIPPGLFRKKFGFESWPDFKPERLIKIRQEYPPLFNQHIITYGTDISAEAIRTSRRNAAAANITDYIRFRREDMNHLKKPADRGVIIINPPYGERIVQDDLNTLYKGIGDTLKRNFSGYNAWIISSNQEALKHIGLRPTRRIPLFNGQLECKYNHYILYEGSHKLKKMNKIINNGTQQDP